jgi:hypothetical protein
MPIVCCDAISCVLDFLILEQWPSAGPPMAGPPVLSHQIRDTCEAVACGQGLTGLSVSVAATASPDP